MALNLELLKTAAGRIATEVSETFTAVNDVLAILRAGQSDPAQQALIDEVTAKIDAQATSLDAFQASLAPAPPVVTP